MLAKVEEDSDPGERDAEAEHEEARQSLSDIAELVAALTSKLDEAQGRGAKTRKLNVPIEVLLRAKRLLQDPEGGLDSEEDIARESGHAARSQNEEEAATSQNQENAATSQMPARRQATEFMQERGFTSFDLRKDGMTLIDHCCIESQKRTCRHCRISVGIGGGVWGGWAKRCHAGQGSRLPSLSPPTPTTPLTRSCYFWLAAPVPPLLGLALSPHSAPHM